MVTAVVVPSEGSFAAQRMLDEIRSNGFVAVWARGLGVDFFNALESSDLRMMREATQRHHAATDH